MPLLQFRLADGGIPDAAIAEVIEEADDDVGEKNQAHFGGAQAPRDHRAGQEPADQHRALQQSGVDDVAKRLGFGNGNLHRRIQAAFRCSNWNMALSQLRSRAALVTGNAAWTRCA